MNRAIRHLIGNRGIHSPVLVDARHAVEAAPDHGRPEVIAPAGQILNRDDSAVEMVLYACL